MRPQRGPATRGNGRKALSHDLAVSCVLPHSSNGAVQGDGIPSPDAVRMMAVNPLNEEHREIGNLYLPYPRRKAELLRISTPEVVACPLELVRRIMGNSA